MSADPTGVGIIPPAQRRSQKTLDRILDATGRLLDGRSFADISVLEICTEAEVSVSSFYARFTSKDALLSVLHHRHLAQQRDLVDAVADQLTEVDLPLEAIVAAALGSYLDHQVDAQPMLQTLRQAEMDHPALADRRRAVDRYATEVVADALMEVIDGADAGTRQRMIFATRACAATIQDAIHPPFAFAADLVLDRDATLREVVRIWLRYVENPGDLHARGDGNAN